MGNSRGTEYSMKHHNLDAKVNKEYWDFSWQDMAEFDVPEMVATIIEKTGYSKIFYIGFS